MKTTYYISKVLYSSTGTYIEKVEAYPCNNNQLASCIELSREGMLSHINKGGSFYTMGKNESGKWLKDKPVYKYGSALKSVAEAGYSDILENIPLLLTKRKTFISYYHKSDEHYRTIFENLTADLIVNKSVGSNDILSDNSDEYVKQLIQKEYLKDTTVLVVLIGDKTKCRKHVDWEISGALNYKVGDIYAGLVGILLPTHPDYHKPAPLPENLPARLSQNVISGYAKVYKWTTDRKKIQEMIEDAFAGRGSRKDQRINSLPQMQKNNCD